MSWTHTLPPHADFKKTVFHLAGTVGEFIYQIGELDALRKPSTEVPLQKITSEEYRLKINYLKECLQKYRETTGHGRGITAVQVGIPERFSVIYTPQKLFILINPVITKKSSKLLRYPEMCMSANPIIAPVVRPAWIECNYYDEQGILQQWTTKDDTPDGTMMNRVLQHEIDHMDGIINIDTVSTPKELILESDPDFYDDAIFEEVEHETIQR
jgi:peptide deformylase